MQKILNIAIFSAARSDLGIIKNILSKMSNNKRFNLKVIFGGAHKTEIFGKTYNEIKEIKNINKYIMKINYKDSSEKGLSVYFSKTILFAQKFINNNKIDSAIILGDRYEMLAFSLVCFNNKIPIIHLCGGSDTFGSLDNDYRYCISRLSRLHLVETKYHKYNLIKNNIKKNIYIVGAPGLENIKNKFISKNEFKKKFNFSFNKRKILVCCFHPESNKSINQNISNLKILIQFLKRRKENIIITYPNADAGFKKYITIIKKNFYNKSNVKFIKSLGIKNYYSLLKFSHIIIGNSSSGIIESASFKIPTINIGDRQKGRFSQKNIIHCKFNLEAIETAFKKANNSKFILSVKKLKNIYYKKNTSSNICNLIYKKRKILI
jgi:UDP-N-acetylglucosamine 2-epimerase